MKRIKKEDMKEALELAEKLNDEYRPRVRLSMQMDYVRKMSAKYGHEGATQLLSNVWRLAERIQRKEQNA